VEEFIREVYTKDMKYTFTYLYLFFFLIYIYTYTYIGINQVVLLLRIPKLGGRGRVLKMVMKRTMI
jgi:hypothetical protein